MSVRNEPHVSELLVEPEALLTMMILAQLGLGSS